MQIPFFNFSDIPFIRCDGGVNGFLPSEITYCDVMKAVSKVFDESEVVFGLFSPLLLRNLEFCHCFIRYPFSIKKTLFDNEIGVLGPVRVIIDYTDATLKTNVCIPTGVSYSTYLLSLKDNGNEIDKIVNLWSSLS